MNSMRRMDGFSVTVSAAAMIMALNAGTAAQAQEHKNDGGAGGGKGHGEGTYGSPPPMDPIDWKTAEQGILENQVQLTFDKDFVKAGEAYFSPDGKWVIFQAVPVPDSGKDADPYYGMYVAKVKYSADERITGLEPAIQISEPGSANTCGFFHPTEPWRVIFGSTVGTPTPGDAPGFQRQSSTYRWMFPAEMDVVTTPVPEIFAARMKEGADPMDIPTTVTTRIIERPGYDAECSYSPDGRFMVYCAVEEAPKLGDLYVYDTTTKKSTLLVTADGYDGGPFFSPDGKRICYRSDRKGNNLLQLYVAELKFDKSGAITGVAREYQLTEGQDVNWGPFWHKSGRYLVYATSAVSHFNYEVFMVDADPGNLAGHEGPVRYGLNQRRITTANGFDGLPVFSADGKWMMWTSQRVTDPASKGASQLWAAQFVLDPDAEAAETAGGGGAGH